MRLDYSPRFLRSYAKANAEIRNAFNKQARLLKDNILHPSLHAKKYDEANDIWQARVNGGGWRFYFCIEGDIYYILDITRHPK